MTRLLTIALLVISAFIVALLGAAGSAEAARSKWGEGLTVSCATVEFFTSRYSLKELRAMARKAGIKVTPRQLAEARQCNRAKE